MWTSLMGSLPLLKSGRSVSVNWENRTGAKGAACQASSALGKSRKGSPCIPSIAAGETVTLAELTGSGALQHIWCTVTDATPKGRFVLRDLVLRMYWDGEETPSVECPLGDFFLNGFARGCSVNSLPVAVNPNRGMNCFLPMPFASHAKITLENQHAGDIPGFFYQVDAVLTDSIPENAARFHAQWRRENVNELIRGVYRAVKEARPSAKFGISPEGYVDHLRSDNRLFTDIDTWLSHDGYVDYIMPQIYWGFEHQLSNGSPAPFAFENNLKTWISLVKKGHAKLYIGLAMYKAGSNARDNTGIPEWKRYDNIISRQVEAGRASGAVAGYCFYEYGSFQEDICQKEVKNLLKVFR